jgi:hypothetical protein
MYMAKETTSPTHFSVALDLLSASQIAALAYGRFTLFGDLHERAQPKPIDRVVSKQLHTVNAVGSQLEVELQKLAQRDPVKALAVADYLRHTSPAYGSTDLADRLEKAARDRSKVSA